MTRRRVELEYSATGGQALESRFRSLGDSGERAMQRLRGAVQPVNPALQAVNASAIEVRSTLEGLTGRMGPLGSVLRALGPAGLAMGAALGGSALALRRLSQAGEEAEQGQLRLQAMLRATEHAAGHTAAAIDEMAVDLARTTNASVSEVGDVATALLAYTSITDENFRRVLQLSQDLAEAGFGSLSRNADRLARSLEEPEKAASRLTRMGVVLNQTQREQIRLMVEAGDKAGAQALILGELERRVGGTGAGAASGLTGAWGTLNTNIQLFTERMAEAYRITERMAGLINRIAGPLGHLADSMTAQGRLAAVNARILEVQSRSRAEHSARQGVPWLLDRLNPFGGDETPLSQRGQDAELQRLLDERREIMAQLDREFRERDRVALQSIRRQEQEAIAALNEELAETVSQAEARVLELSLTPVDKIERTAQEARAAVERAIEQGADPEVAAGAIAAIEERRQAELAVIENRAAEATQRRAEAEAARAAQQQQRNVAVLAGLERELALQAIADERERARVTFIQSALERVKDAGPELRAQVRAAAGELFDARHAEQQAGQVQAAIEGLGRELESLEREQLSAVASLNRWRAETLASLEQAAEGYEAFAGLVEEIYRRRLPQARQEDLEGARDFASGMTRGLQEIAEAAGDAARQSEQFFGRAFRGIEEILTHTITRGKADWSSFLTGLVEDFIRMQVRLAVIQPLAQGLQSMTGTSAVVAHTGGIIGGALPVRNVPAAAFAGAPRYHAGGLVGLQPHERPAILRLGEEVLPPEHPRHRRNAQPSANITINVSAPGGDPAQVRRSIGRATSELARVVARGQRLL